MAGNAGSTQAEPKKPYRHPARLTPVPVPPITC
jgi:hypothetical protein